MQASAKPKSAEDRRDFVVIPSDQVRVAPSDAEISDLLRAAARQHSEGGAQAAPDPNPSALVPVPAVDTTFRATNVNDNVPVRGQTFGRRLMRAVATLLLAMGIGAAALTWQTFGYAAKKVLLTWVPKWAIVASLPLDKLGLGPNSSPADNPADTTPAPIDASAPATTDAGATTSVVTAAPAPSPDATERLQSMSRDLASANQEIATLKAGIAELKASQQQMSRDLAKAASDRVAAEQAAAKAKAAARKLASQQPYSPTTTAAAPAPAYRPNPSAYSAQAAIPQPAPQTAAPSNVPPPPMQLRPQTDPGLPPTALRPPMPVQ